MFWVFLKKKNGPDVKNGNKKPFLFFFWCMSCKLLTLGGTVQTRGPSPSCLKQPFLCVLSPLPVSSGTNFPLVPCPQGDHSPWCAALTVGMGRLTSNDILTAWRAAGARCSAYGNAVKEGRSEQNLKSTKPQAQQPHTAVCFKKGLKWRCGLQNWSCLFIL